MFILRQLQASEPRHGNLSFITSYEELVVDIVNMYPSPGFRYPRCPITSGESCPAVILHLRQHIAYTTTSYQDLYEKCWPDEQGEQDSDDASWPDSPASTRPTEVEDDAPDEQSWCELEDASENVNLLRGEDRFGKSRLYRLKSA
jgi:hypothetical protein